ncbi:MAG: hypothetical protein K0Q73_5655 [Paenibacillus sp.]|nr:hypothetical protein [Paenibacillus sp.]
MYNSWYYETRSLKISYYDLLAQLGEHYLDRVGVSGSSPLQVIHTKREALDYQGFLFLCSYTLGNLPSFILTDFVRQPRSLIFPVK